MNHTTDENISLIDLQKEIIAGLQTKVLALGKEDGDRLKTHLESISTAVDILDRLMACKEKHKVGYKL